MDKLLQFVENHWLTWLALVVILALLVYEELRNKLSGVQRLSPQELTTLLNRDEVVVVDIRDDAAFAQGHIVGSVHIPQNDLITNIDKLDKYKDKGIVLIDGTGQGIMLANKLRNRGVKLYTLSGGINTWKGMGLPLVKK